MCRGPSVAVLDEVAVLVGHVARRLTDVVADALERDTGGVHQRDICVPALVQAAIRGQRTVLRQASKTACQGNPFRGHQIRRAPFTYTSLDASSRAKHASSAASRKPLNQAVLTFSCRWRSREHSSAVLALPVLLVSGRAAPHPAMPREHTAPPLERRQTGHLFLSHTASVSTVKPKRIGGIT